jgi:hypothetical protein
LSLIHKKKKQNERIGRNFGNKIILSTRLGSLSRWEKGIRMTMMKINRKLCSQIIFYNFRMKKLKLKFLQTRNIWHIFHWNAENSFHKNMRNGIF